MKLHKRKRRIFAILYIRQTIQREQRYLESLMALCEDNKDSERSQGIMQGLKTLQGALQAITGDLEMWSV